MSEEVLWYAARVSGLMAWILSFGALASGLLARSEPAYGTSAGRWAGDTRNLMARLGVVALLVHTAATVASERFDLTIVSAITARLDGQWLVPAMVVGVVCGILVLLVEVWRLLTRSLPPAVELLLLLISAGVVAGGAYHGWQLGSDTQNPLAVAIVVLCAILLFGAAAVGLTTVVSGPTSPVTAVTHDPRADTGADNMVMNGTAMAQQDPSENKSSQSPKQAPFDTRLSVSLSKRVNIQAEDVFDRGPEIASARDVSVPHHQEQGSTPAAEESEDESSGSWSMRKLPDAPKPAHRDRKNR